MAGKDFSINRETKTVVILEDTAATADVAGSTITNPGYKGAVFHLAVVDNGTGTADSIDVFLKHVDPTSGTAITMTGAAFSQITDSASDVLTVYPGIAETANETVSDVLGTTYRATAVVAGTAPSYAFTLTADYVP